MTSSSSGPGRAAARSPATSPRRASASCCSNGVTGCPASRRTGRPVDVFVDGRYISAGQLVQRRRTSPSSSRRCTTSSAAPPSCTAPRCTACASRTSANCSTTTGCLARVAHQLPGHGAVLHRRPSDLYQVHGARGEDPTEPPASAPYPYPAVSHEPRIQQLSDDLEKQGYHPFHAPCGILVDEANLPYSTCVKCGECDGFPCPLHAKSDAEVIGVRPALEHDNVTLLRNARAVKLETNPAGTAVTGVVVERDGETERYHGRHRGRGVRRGQLRQAAARLGQRPAPERAGQRLRPGRPQLHVPRLPGGARDVEGAQPDRLPEDARRQRLLLQRPRLRLPDGQHPDDRQVAGGDVPRREAAGDQVRAELGAARRRRARGRLLAVHRGPSAAGQPGDARTGRQRPHLLHSRATRPPPSSYSASSSPWSARSTCTKATWPTGACT